MGAERVERMLQAQDEIRTAATVDEARRALRGYAPFVIPPELAPPDEPDAEQPVPGGAMRTPVMPPGIAPTERSPALRSGENSPVPRAGSRSSATMNAELEALYRSHWDALVRCIPLRRHYSWPLLVRVNESYAGMNRRCLFVGQEAYGWGQGEYGPFDPLKIDDPVRALLDLYRVFNFGENYRATPFWIACRSLHRRLNPNRDPFGLAWSCLGRVDRWRPPEPNARAEDYVERAMAQLPLLREEIRILEADVVVFFFGPNYIPLLKLTLPGIELRNLDADLPEGGILLRGVAYRELPSGADAFFTYHPGYLQRRRRLTAVIEAIARLTQDDPSCPG